MHTKYMIVYFIYPHVCFKLNLVLSLLLHSIFPSKSLGSISLRVVSSFGLHLCVLLLHIFTNLLHTVICSHVNHAVYTAKSHFGTKGCLVYRNVPKYRLLEGYLPQWSSSGVGRWGGGGGGSKRHITQF